MKIKELHIRNIASIEKADINFETDLWDASSQSAASLFLISGDTGSGKSAILDAICLALYRLTPRMPKSSKKNSFTNSFGEETSITSISQYTRLGISHRDECYSELLFEGNDGIDYCARLELGITVHNTSRAPKHKVRRGGEDWVVKDTAEIIQQAVGLSFDQFCKMALLAQGQFTEFLCGDKEKRSVILERLTNTEIFSQYGVAIHNIFKRLDAEVKTKGKVVESESDHLLSDQKVGELDAMRQQAEQQKVGLEKRMSLVADQLKLADAMERRDKSSADLAAHRRLMEQDEFKEAVGFVELWDRTSDQRDALKALRNAECDMVAGQKESDDRKVQYVKLLSDLHARREHLVEVTQKVAELDQWIALHADKEPMFDSAAATLVHMGNYQKTTDNVAAQKAVLQELAKLTPELKEKLAKALETYQRWQKAVDQKQAETDENIRRRDALKPTEVAAAIASINRDLADSQSLIAAFAAWKRDHEAVVQKKAQLVEQEALLDPMKKRVEETRAIAETRRKEYEKAMSCFSTMNASIDEKLAELRFKMAQDHTDICPLCGQHVDRLLSPEEFAGILSPLQKEKEAAKVAFDVANGDYQTADKSYSKLLGQYNAAKDVVDASTFRLDGDRQKLSEKFAAIAVAWDENTELSIQHYVDGLNEALGGQQEAQRQIAQIQSTIDALHAENKRLVEQRDKALDEKNAADNNLKSNEQLKESVSQTIESLNMTVDSLSLDIDTAIANVFPQWRDNLAVTGDELKCRSQEYFDRKKETEKLSSELDSLKKLLAQAEAFNGQVLADFPEWEVEVAPTLLGSADRVPEWWAKFISLAAIVKQRMDNDRAVVAEKKAMLDSWCGDNGIDISVLDALLGQECLYQSRRKLVDDARMRCHALETLIGTARNEEQLLREALLMADGDVLPDREALLAEQKAVGEEQQALLTAMGSIGAQLEAHRKNESRLSDLKDQLEEAKKRCNHWKLLDDRFGGTRFRTIVQSHILRPLLDNANIYLSMITDRYTLTCSNDNEQLSILVVDHYNRDMLRSASALSGGEKFMVSLALSLALSSLNRPDMNVNILFIDEGFGTLDERMLNSVMNTLERLQTIASQSQRRVGIISHREELSYIYPQIMVKASGEGRSRVSVVAE